MTLILTQRVTTPISFHPCSPRFFTLTTHRLSIWESLLASSSGSTDLCPLPLKAKEHPKKGKALPSNKSIQKEPVTKFKTNLDIVKESSSVEINLFGRMNANNPTLSIDAAAQVAHAMSVSNSISQSDFYTALDDLEDGHSGGAMMGTIEFSSPVFYRYANINLTELVSRHLLVNSREVVAERVSEFIRAFITTLPSGKQSSFAAVTMP